MSALSAGGMELPWNAPRLARSISLEGLKHPCDYSAQKKKSEKEPPFCLNEVTQ
jgi:hypothetical protein